MWKIISHLVICSVAFRFTTNAEIVDLSTFCHLDDNFCLVKSNISKPISITCDQYDSSYNLLHLKSLFIRNSPLNGVPQVKYCTPNLINLIIYKSQLVNVGDNAFSEWYSLRTISMQHNRLGAITELMFRSLQNLYDLRLGYNQVIYIHEQSFRHTQNLQYLELNNNDIAELSIDTFLGLDSLKHIDLSYNLMKTLPDGIFETNKNLRTIILNNNKLINLESTFFMNFDFLIHLDLSGNTIKSINLNSIDTVRIIDVKLQDLVINDVVALYASKNQLRNLTICNPNSVQEIDVHSNSLSSWECFHGMHSLQKLNVAKNPIGIINDDDFLTFQSLQILNMDTIGLKSLDESTFIQLEKLTAIDVANNQLMELNEEVLRPLINLERLYIGGNFFKQINYEAYCKYNKNLKEIAVSARDFNISYLAKMSNYLNLNHITLDVRSNTTGFIDKKLFLNTTSNNSEVKTDANIEHHHHHYGNLSATNILIVLVLLIVVIILVMQFAKLLTTHKIQNTMDRFRPHKDRSQLDEEESASL